MNNSKIFARAAFVMLALVLAAGCSASPWLSVMSSGSVPNNVLPAAPAYQTGTTAGSATQGITVVGIGTASGTPDMAQVNVGVETEAADVQKAVTDNQTKMNALLAAIKAQGIDAKDIRTSNFSVFTQQQPLPAGAATNETTTAPVTYHVSNQVQVTLHDVTRLGSVLDKVIAAGANNIFGVTFGISDTTKLQGDARALAAQDAKSRADSIAKLEGVTLGNVISVSENISTPGPVFAEAKSLGSGTPIQPGEQDVTINLQVTYAIK